MHMYNQDVPAAPGCTYRNWIQDLRLCNTSIVSPKQLQLCPPLLLLCDVGVQNTKELLLELQKTLHVDQSCKHLPAAGCWRQQQQGYHHHDQQSNLHGCQCERKILDLFSAVPCKLTIELGFAQQ